MSRGNKSYGRRRNLLHKNQLEAFTNWVSGRGYIIHPTPEKAIYECLRIEWPVREGNNPHIVFYTRDPPHAHITVPDDGVPLVREFLSERRNANNVTSLDEFKKARHNGPL